MNKLINYTNDYLKDTQPAKVVCYTAGITATSLLLYQTISDRDFKENLQKKLFKTLRSMPGVSDVVKKERAKAKENLKSIFKTDVSNPHYTLPLKGVSHDALVKEMKNLATVDESHWKDSKVSGCVYLGEKEHTDLLNEAYSLFSLSNPLHPGVFPSIRKFETETISMVSNMLNAHPKVVGSLTSGGTESIFMAVKAYRDFYKDKTNNPEIVVPVTIHAAFDKACEYLKIKIRHVPVDKNYKVDISKMKSMITKDTILVAGSAVNFPHGIIDDIPAIAKIAQENGIGCHVDACLGGFILPFAEELGYDIPPFDWRVPGVTSISIDTHKFGYAAKGTSVILFGNKKLRRAMYFVAPNWPGGIYASPTLPGSRPGGLVAACWASLVAMGRDGFREKAKGVMQTTKNIIEGLKSIPEITIIGEPKAMVIAFTCDNVFYVNDYMSKKGWHLNALQRPNSLHICVTAKMQGMDKQFIDDLRQSVNDVKVNKDNLPKDGTAPIYGSAHGVPDREMVGTILSDFIDQLITSDHKPSQST
ncbi:sphingosine-1-phosphate lyase [Dictyostelium purpureum]|uniref:sphinganine-1-phosphate aldolase n=1 Tax=Dictyostelium purpureum TaxID=5786 RepID=F0Z9G5_DICPU|nr:sphingosine-1-phosphate lyase [Dictyostelium purpureum]EGC39408.1 sphingosine-1-phosphate lyase [Dictyostelium purpureum]|eukprot:XP_003284082.1 sphingosine-1-phosphate lyase [Dictyostelium purpureum]